MVNREYDYVEELELIRLSLDALVGDRLKNGDYDGAGELVASAQAGYWGSLNRAVEDGCLNPDNFKDAKKRALSGPFGEFRALISTAQDFDKRLKAGAESAGIEAQRQNDLYGV